MSPRRRSPLTSEQTEHDLPTDTQIGLTSDAAAVLLARVGPN